MKTPHKHAALIKAWADGAEIQWYDSHPRQHRWFDCGPNQPSWSESVQFRIKPEPKPDVVTYDCIELEDVVGALFGDGENNLALTWCGETRKLKRAEVLFTKNNTCKNNSCMTSQL